MKVEKLVFKSISCEMQKIDFAKALKTIWRHFFIYLPLVVFHKNVPTMSAFTDTRNCMDDLHMISTYRLQPTIFHEFKFAIFAMLWVKILSILQNELKSFSSRRL